MSNTTTKTNPTTDTTLSFVSGEEQDAARSSFSTGEETPGDVSTNVDTPEQPVEAPESPQGDGQAPTDQGDDIDVLRAENAALRAEMTRLRIGAETGVPAELLTADTEDGLRDQADALLTFAESRRSTMDFGAGRRGEPLEAAEADPIRKALGR